jgi:DNA-binding NtrC family response regulator
MGQRDASILVIEDDEAFRRVVVTILERGGFKVIAVRDFTAAIAIVESDQPIDLLLTDVGMPVGTPHGLSIAQMAKTRRPRLKVLYMSGSYDAGQIGAMVDGAAFLSKPFRPERLIQSVETALA